MLVGWLGAPAALGSARTQASETLAPPETHETGTSTPACAPAPLPLVDTTKTSTAATPSTSTGHATEAPTTAAPSTSAVNAMEAPTTAAPHLSSPHEAETPARAPVHSAPEPPPPLDPLMSDAPFRGPPPPAVPQRPLRPFIPHGEPDTGAPLSGGTWVAHGGLTLLPLGGVWAATRVGGDTRLGATAAEAAAGTLLASLPGRFLFVHPSYPQGRWLELEVGAFGAAMVATPPIAALGTWGMGEVAFGDSERPGRAYLGALGGATVGMLLGIAAHEGLRHLAGSSERLDTLRRYLALSLIGTGATVGYQWIRTPADRR